MRIRNAGISVALFVFMDRRLLRLALSGFLLALFATAHAGLLPGERQNACDTPLTLPSTAEIEKELVSFLQLSEEALAMRAEAIRLYRALQVKKDQGTPLNGEDLQMLNEGAVNLLKQREEILRRALAHECWVQSPPAAAREAGDIHRAGVLISVSAALLLYDNYLSAISLYRNDPALRRHINRADLGFGLSARELQRADVMFNSAENRRRVRAAVKWYRKHARKPAAQAAEIFAGYADAANYLRQSVEQSPSYHMVRRRRPLQVLGNTFEIFGNITLDSLVGLKNDGEYLSSGLFGNTVGLVETRHGKLDGRPEVAREVGGRLQAGDILLEKTPFRLTDTFIPGHWGHAAIWIGGEAELRELGIWDHPVVAPHQAAIRAGRGIVEALRSGVEMNTLAHFMNIDDLAVLRHTALSPQDRAEVILQTLRQVGKAYDFNFNAESTQRVFCSKLVYLAYGDVDWPTSRFLGRFTISPDDIAQRSIAGGPLSIVLIYHDGKLAKPPLQETMARFLDAPESSASGS
ncbi:MAG: hypothetical protein LBK55_01345 [Azoarcus sp.]|jgi:uncharacterized protein YycO|nr:hypothetical protein [Azoarcus sp.]